MFGKNLLCLGRQQELDEGFGNFTRAVLVYIRIYDGNRVIDLNRGAGKYQLIRLPGLPADEHLVLVRDRHIANAFLEGDDGVTGGLVHDGYALQDVQEEVLRARVIGCVAFHVTALGCTV